MKRFLLFSLAVFLFTGCEVSSSEEGDKIVSGVNLSEVFAEPTQSELNAVLADWATRDPRAEGVTLEVEQSLTVGAGVPATLRIFGHEVDGVTHYGAVIAPDNLAPGSTPVLVYSHGGDSGVSVDGEVLLLLGLFPDLASQFIIVVPSFRDEPLFYNGSQWRSEGPASPWDRDVDDTFALIDVAREAVPAADVNRIAVLGFSRGAGVGMLMDVRSNAVKGVVDFFGPTDFFGPFVQEVTSEILEGSHRELPGLDYLSSEWVLPYQAGEVSLEDIRVELVRRSPALFADRIERLQIHHGTADVVVPVSQAEAMIEAMQNAGHTSASFESFLYAGGGHNPFTLEGSFTRASAFLESMLLVQ